MVVKTLDSGLWIPLVFFIKLRVIVDGTKGFMRGDQFAICLALIENGKVQLGLMGCPNLSSTNNHAEKGCIFVAEKGKGALQVFMHLNH